GRIPALRERRTHPHGELVQIRQGGIRGAAAFGGVRPIAGVERARRRIPRLLPALARRGVTRCWRAFRRAGSMNLDPGLPGHDLADHRGLREAFLAEDLEDLL